MFNHGQTIWIWKLAIINHGPMFHSNKDCLDMKINHGPMLHCDKDCFYIEINHGQPCLFRVYNIHARVYIRWVYNFYPLGLLFPWVYNINPLGLLI